MPQTPPPVPKKRFICFKCGKVIEVPYGIPGKPPQCPYCGAPAIFIHRLDKGGGWGRGRGRRFGFQQ